jgi:hypothetical protein
VGVDGGVGWGADSARRRAGRARAGEARGGG